VKLLGRSWSVLAIAALMAGLASCGGSADPAAPAGSSDAAAPASTDPVVRVAVFNIRELSGDKLRDATEGVGQDPQTRAAATIVQRVRPDILVINEIDHDRRVMDVGLEFTARRFNDLYLENGEEPISYPHAWAAPNNTGILSGLDLNMDGVTATDADRGTRAHGDDSWGYGEYPGQYSMCCRAIRCWVTRPGRFESFSGRISPATISRRASTPTT
jgi:hypothetical protein